MSLRNAAIHGFKWSLLGELGSRVIGPVVFIVLARILLPEDFGVVAAATVAISFSQVFWDSGLARALIQRDTRDEEAFASTIFQVNLVLSVLVVIAMWAAAAPLAAFFSDQRIANVLRILSLQAPLAAACAVMVALMQRRFDFRRLFWVRLITTGGPGLASIPLALVGWSYWALVFGVLVGQFLQTLALWTVVGWRPRPGIDRQHVASLAGFAGWTLLSGMLGWLYGWLDAIVVGRYLGAHDMGVYRTGNTFVLLIFGLLFSPLLPVLYSVFSRAQHDLARMREALMTVVHSAALICLPIGMGLLVLGDDLGSLAFGSHWSGIGLVIGVLGAVHAIGWLTGMNGELYRAMGKPHAETLAMALMLVVYVSVYLMSVRGGLENFLWARLSLAGVALVYNVLVCWLVVRISPLRWVRLGLWATISAITAALVASSTPDHLPLSARLAVSALLGFGVYGLMVILLERRFLGYLFSILSSSRSKEDPTVQR